MVACGRTLRELRLGLLACAMSLLLATTMAAAEPPGLARDFDAALARLKADSRPVGPLGFDGYWVEAVAIARAYGPAAARPLGDRIGGPAPDRIAEKLALMTLAALSDDPAAVAELSSRLKEGDFHDGTACMALTYATPSAAMAVVDDVMAERARQPGVLVAMSTVARFFGEPGRDAALEASFKAALADGLPISKPSQDEIAANLVALRQRLARPVEERPGWSTQDMAVWRAVQSMPNYRGLDVSRENRASLVCATLRFTPQFLKDRLTAATVDFNEHALVLKIVRNQRPAELVPELAKMVDGVWPSDMDVYSALASIGTRDALALLEKFVSDPGRIDVDEGEGPLSPKRTEASSRENLAIRLCEILSKRGDRKTLDLMEALAEDDSRPASIRAASAKARDALKRRFRIAP